MEGVTPDLEYGLKQEARARELGMMSEQLKGRSMETFFEAAEDELSLNQFMRRLRKALHTLIERLYRNTLEVRPITPYRALGLHTRAQLEFLVQNLDLIRDYHAEDHAEGRCAPRPVLG